MTSHPTPSLQQPFQAIFELFLALAQRLRQAMRSVAGSPGFSLPALVTLAIGLGAALAVWTLVDSVVLRPLPYPDPDQLVYLDHAGPGVGADDGLGFIPGIFWNLRERSSTLRPRAGGGLL